MFGCGKNRVWYLLQKWHVKNANILALTTPPLPIFLEDEHKSQQFWSENRYTENCDPLPLWFLYNSMTSWYLFSFSRRHYIDPREAANICFQMHLTLVLMVRIELWIVTVTMPKLHFWKQEGKVQILDVLRKNTNCIFCVCLKTHLIVSRLLKINQMYQVIWLTYSWILPNFTIPNSIVNIGCHKDLSDDFWKTFHWLGIITLW
jgi:hypothetical protein